MSDGGLDLCYDVVDLRSREIKLARKLLYEAEVKLVELPFGNHQMQKGSFITVMWNTLYNLYFLWQLSCIRLYHGTP